MDKQVIKTRRRARRLVLQALYQWLMAGGELSEIEAEWRAAHDATRVDFQYFQRLFYGVVTELVAVEQAFEPYLDRPIATLNPIELTALRIGAYELLFVPEVPCRVVLDESVALARAFGSQDGHRYVNGVLHHVAKATRVYEMPDS